MTFISRTSCSRDSFSGRFEILVGKDEEAAAAAAAGATDAAAAKVEADDDDCSEESSAVAMTAVSPFVSEDG